MTTMQLHVLSRLLAHADSILKSAYLAFAFTLLAWILRGDELAISWVLIGLSLALIAVQHYVAVRVKFDAGLLAHVAQMIDTGTSEKNATQQLDQSLLHFGLMPQAKAGRDWNVRLQGCLRLFKIQISLLVLQYLLMFTMVVLCTTLLR